MEPFIRGITLAAAGSIDDALAHAFKQRSAARRNLDQFGFASNSYVAVLALSQRGLSHEADHLMSSIFALGRAGFLVSFLHDAMLRLAGLSALTEPKRTTPSLSVQARTKAHPETQAARGSR
ncbi:hypothetical protein ACIP9X_19020 [Arthrobacter sp. NPDC093125]|uniref:hypothetical protein n=1 Tax=Arthrobacter sp. NPDC093125 TaxID=3363944 RepID=UPI003812F056